MPIAHSDKIDCQDKIVMRSIVTSLGCWEWTGRKQNMGYGRIAFNGNPDHLAHRASYIVFVGPIPQGLEIDHLCRNTLCVNPAHLEPVTHLENVRRGGKMLKDVCAQGHPYDAIDKNGHRKCRTCARAVWAEHRRRYPDRVKKRRQKWVAANPERVKELSKRSRSKPENRERRNAYLREYRKRPYVRERTNRRQNEYRAKNRERVNANWRKNYHERKARRDAAS